MELCRISFTLNGERIVVDVDPDMTLLQYLRNEACLKGSKLGCGTGHCGACTVLLNGRPSRSCVLRLKSVENKSVLTIEGLHGEHGGLHPIQEAFLDAGAVQCGFCTPGMILTAKALLDKNPRPSYEEIIKAFAHNYCRCTGYTKIIKAIELASERMNSDHPLSADVRFPLEQTSYRVQGLSDCSSDRFRILGRHQRDFDGASKVSGRLAFADDLSKPGMLIGRPVWAGVPHARILHIEIDEALSVHGVIAVLTAEDVPGENGFGMAVSDQPVLCSTEVNFICDVVALVVAEDEASAQEGVRRVHVELEPLPGVFDINNAPEESQVIREIRYQQGDIEAVRQEQDLLVLKEHFETTWVEHAYLEPESVLAYPESGKLIVHTPTQAPFDLRKQIAKVLAIPEESVRVIVTPLGGGFGGKGDATVQPMAALAAYLTGHPVQITLTREESLGMSTKKHPYNLDYEIGMTRSGELRYVDADIVSDGGPYANLSPRVIDQSCIFAVGPYRIAAGRVHGRCVRTNNVLSSAFRGFGINQVSFAMETLMDQAAEALDIDPFELREKNIFLPGDKTFSGEILYHSVGAMDTLKACKEGLEHVVSQYRSQYPDGDRFLGVGMATCFKNVGAGKGRVDNAGATVTRNKDGSYLLEVSGVDMGQGFRTAMVQLAAETLGVAIDKIDLLNGDTDKTSIHGSAVGERQTLVSGMAVVKACQLLLEKSAEISSDEPLSVHYDHEAPRTFSLGDEEGRRSVPPEQYKNYPAYAYATQAVVLEVDKSTGHVQVLDVVVANDTGRVLNPTVLEGQIEGCCAMGIGYALSEQFPMEKGVPLARNYGGLGVPTIRTTPRYHITLIEDPEPGGPYGAKGISEVGTVPMTAAILNAIHDAIGVRITTLPATPEKILTALRSSKSV